MEDRRIIKLLEQWDNTAFEFLIKVFTDEFTRFSKNYFEVEEKYAKNILVNVVLDIELDVKIGYLNEGNLDIDKQIFAYGRVYLKKIVERRQRRRLKKVSPDFIR